MKTSLTFPRNPTEKNIRKFFDSYVMELWVRTRKQQSSTYENLMTEKDQIKVHGRIIWPMKK